jgi:hypothetical protein
MHQAEMVAEDFKFASLTKSDSIFVRRKIKDELLKWVLLWNEAYYGK